jgi:hypothetical protein
VLGRDVVVLELPRLLERLVEHARERGAGRRLLRGALDRRLRCERGLGLGAQSGRVGDELLDELLLDQREQQVLGVELGVAGPARLLLRGRDRLLALDRQLVEVHQCLGSGCRWVW